MAPNTVTIDTFLNLDIRIGKIISAKLNPKAKKPAYKLQIDFGPSIGIKQSSAQLVQNYQPEDLIDRQIIAVVNLPERNIAGYISQVLILAAMQSDHGDLALLKPDRTVELGSPIA